MNEILVARMDMCIRRNLGSQCLGILVNGTVWITNMPLVKERRPWMSEKKAPLIIYHIWLSITGQIASVQNTILKRLAGTWSAFGRQVSKHLSQIAYAAITK